MALRYRIPLPGPFYYSGRVGPKYWLPRSSNTGTGPMGFVVKWFIIYPGVALFGAGLAIMLAPFYGLYRLICWALQEQRRQQVRTRRFPVQRPVLQCPAPHPASRSYGFVPAQLPVRPVPYGFVPAQREPSTVGGRPFGLDRYV